MTEFGYSIRPQRYRCCWQRRLPRNAADRESVDTRIGLPDESAVSQEKIRAAPCEGGDVRARLSPPIRDRCTQQIAKGESGLIQEISPACRAGLTRRLCRRYGVQQN
jgi:hypothetical protein